MRAAGSLFVGLLFIHATARAQAQPDPQTSTQAASLPPPAPAPAPAPPATAVPAPAPVPAPPASTAPVIPPDHSFVHLGASYPAAQLELKSSVDQGEWRAACLAPCDRLLLVNGQLARVTAPGMTTSNVFRIEPGSGTALVRVDGGSARMRSLGLVGLGVGIPTALAGMALFGYGKFADEDAMRVSGAIVLATGAVVLVASLPLLIIGGTKVRDAHGTTIARTLATGRASF